MRVILLIPLLVAIILTMLYFVTTRDDEEGDRRGILETLIDLLSWR
jgi:hypothetical protein